MTKIDIEKTKLKDRWEHVLDLFHVSPKMGGVTKYYPLSHFGTNEAANMRAQHFIYKAMGKQDPMHRVPSSQLDFYISELGDKVPPLAMQKVHLYMKHPLKIDDLAKHDLSSYHNWFQKSYSPKSQYLNKQEWHQLFGCGVQNLQYKKLLTDFIFLDPFTHSEETLIQELNSETLFDASEWNHRVDGQTYPAFLRPVLEKAKKVPFALAEHVALQRMIRFLEGEGYDGFSYTNCYEDEGQLSYIIFRPEQVFNAFLQEKQHIIPMLDSGKKDFLLRQEKGFFGLQHTLSPTERIFQYKMQKSKSRLSK